MCKEFNWLDLLRRELPAKLLGIGLTGVYFVGRVMQSILFGVSAIDFSAFGVVGLLLLFAALLASYLPASRARPWKRSSS